MPRNILLGALLMAATAAVSSSSPASKIAYWSKASVQCVPDDAPAAIARSVSFGAIHCVLEASKISVGFLVAQFNELTRACLVFNFQSVCRQLAPGRTPSCEVFYRFPVDAGLISAKLSNFWIGDDVNRLENLVCQADADTNRLHPVGVQWTGEGAVFDGIAAHTVLNKTSISFTSGLTWLLKIKRQPRVAPLIQFSECSTLGTGATYGVHIWEYYQPLQLYARAERVTGTLIPIQVTQANQLSASPDEWLNIGFTANPSGNSTNIFLGNAFLPKSSITPVADPLEAALISQPCMVFGIRASTEVFKGTVRALALAGSPMSEDEIRQFFALLA